jgi:hypothetical protein
MNRLPETSSFRFETTRRNVNRTPVQAWRLRRRGARLWKSTLRAVLQAISFA